jgi:hypothetical protein
MKARIVIGHRVYFEDGEDDFGIPLVGWRPPVDLHAFGLAPGVSAEPVPGREAVITTLSILLPPGTLTGPRDRYVVDGAEWEQDGEVGDYTRSPFPRRFGVVVNLKRVTG